MSLYSGRRHDLRRHLANRSSQSMSRHQNSRYTIGTLFTIVALMSQTVGAEFTKVPHSVSVDAGMIAVFDCQNPVAEFIRWRLNNNSLAPPYPPGITTPERGILHILGHPIYNRTQIVCIAFILGLGVFSTPDVTLTVYAGFVEVPTSLNVTQYQPAMYTCTHKTADAIVWAINDTVHTQDLPTIASVNNHGNSTELTFSSCINNTAIECRAVYFGTNLSERSPQVSMKCQGLLGAIDNLASSGSDIITWLPPFSLDLTGVSVNILYCVDIYNITCGGRVRKRSDCGVNETRFVISPVDYLFEVTISARNNVLGSRNGKPFSKQAEVMQGNLTGVDVGMLASREVAVGLTLTIAEKKTPFKVKPTSFSLSAVPMDSVDHIRLNCSTATNTTGTMISLTATCSFPIDRVYSIRVWAFGCYLHVVSDSVVLSTHRVQVTSIQLLRLGGVQMTGRFLNDSEVAGFLAIFYSTAGKNVVHYYIILKPPSQLNFKTVLADHLSGQFAVSIFVIGTDNLPLPRAIGVPKMIKVKSSPDPSNKETVPIEYTITPNSTGAYIACTFKKSSLTNCLVIVHQQISQLSSSGLMNIKSYSFPRSRFGDTAYGFIPGVDLEHYQVGVVGGKRIMLHATEPGSDDKTSLTGAIVGTVVGVVTAVAIIVTVLVIGIALYMYLYLRRHKTTTQEPVYSEVSPGLQYETIVDDESGYTGSNHYVESVPLGGEEETESSAEVQPLLTPPVPLRQEVTRVVADNAPVNNVDESHEAHQTSDRPPPDSLDSGSNDPTYTQALPKSSTTVPPPAATEKLVYDDIQKFQNQQGQLYALTQLESTSKGALDDLNVVVYSEIQPQPKTNRVSIPLVSESAAQDSHEAFIQHRESGGAPPDRVTSDNGFSSTTYTQPMLTMLSTTVPTPAATEKLVYDDIQNPQGQHYALSQLKSTSKEAPNDLHQVVYSDCKPQLKIQHDTTSTETLHEPTCNKDAPPGHESLTVDQLLSHLQPHTSKWFNLGKALLLDGDELEKIYTSSDCDEDSLREMLEVYMARSDLNHSWEEVEAALKETNSSTGAVQPTTQDRHEQGVIIHVHNSKPTLLPARQKQPDQYLHDSQLQERAVHAQCEGDLTTESSDNHQDNQVNQVSEALIVGGNHTCRPGRDRANRRSLALDLEGGTSPMPQDVDTNVKLFSGKSGDSPSTPPRNMSPIGNPEGGLTSAPATTENKETEPDLTITISPTEETSQ